MHTDESEAHAEPPPDGGAKQRRDLELARGCTVEAFYARRLQDKAIRETAVGTPPPPLDLGQYARLSDTQKLRVYTAYVAHGGDQSASPPGYVVERRCDGARGSARPAAAAAAAAGAEPAPVVCRNRWRTPRETRKYRGGARCRAQAEPTGRTLRQRCRSLGEGGVERAVRRRSTHLLPA